MEGDVMPPEFQNTEDQFGSEPTRLNTPIRSSELLDLFLLAVKLMKRSGESKTALKDYINGVYRV